MSHYLLELKNITKRFPGVLANDQISLRLKKGEIHALLGENGAGKTTLMNILYGLYQPDEGEILINGKEVTISGPEDAIRQGIGMVHQHFMLIPVFTVTENVMLGAEIVQMGGWLDRKKAAARVAEISEQYKLAVSPAALIKDLPVGVQQRVEIIKLLYREADILIFDEPTAVLTPQEADELVQIMRALVERGKSIIFITHKLREVLEVADQITVIRRGKIVGSAIPAEVNQNQLAEMMVGREVNLQLEKKQHSVGKPVLQIKQLDLLNRQGKLVVSGLDLEVRAGEIMGIAGVQGNGQTELVEAVTGLRSIDAGEIELLGHSLAKATPRMITELGVAHVPEDRQKEGLVLAYGIDDNLILNRYYLPPFDKKGILQRDVIGERAERLVKEFDIRTPSSQTAVASLSGGNQQKVIMAREFDRPIKFLVAAQPTRGLDVGSIEYIHRRIIEKRDNGAGVLVVSSELDEILQLSDRIAVMFEGKIVAILDASEANKEQLGLLMAGIRGSYEGN